MSAGLRKTGSTLARRSAGRLGIYFIVTVAAIFMADAAGAAIRDGCIQDFDPDTDYFPDKAKVDHARAFSVTYHGHYKVLTVHRPDGSGARDVVVLIHCGAPAPRLQGKLATATKITIPTRTLGANEDLSLNRARILGYTDGIVAVGGEGLYAPELRSRWETGAAVAIGESFHGQPDYEKLLTAAPDVVFLSTASLERAASIKRARSLGLPAVPTLSWIEPSVLGQAEWVYHTAAFLNAEQKANEIMDSIKERYRHLSARARARESRPTLIWLDSAEQQDQWRVPESDWTARLISDAGGRTPWADAGGAPTRIVTTEQILTASDDAAAFVTTTAALSETGLLGALNAADAVRAGRLYDVHRRSRPAHDAYDWYESAVIEVDRVLEDFVALLHPDLLPGHTFRYLQPAGGSGYRARGIEER